MTDDVVTLAVERVGVRGDGIAHHAGERVYLPFAAPGDRVRVRLTGRRDGRVAEIVELLAAGERAAPVCPHFGVCGGCALQHLPATAYDAAKEDQIRAALAQHGIAGGVVVAPLLRLPAGTRRRARFAIHRPRNATEPAAVGFNARASHRVVDLRQCAVLHPALVALIAPLRALAAQCWPLGTAGAASATLTDSGIDLLLDLPQAPDLAAHEVLAEFAGAQDLARLAWRALGMPEAIPEAVRRPVRIMLAGIAVDLPSDAFLQASAEADHALSEHVLAGIGDAQRVADLFAGLGTFAFSLARRASVHAVEGSALAIKALDAAARRAGLAGRVTAECRDLETRPLTARELARYDAVVFDPPRAGARAQSDALAASSVPRIVAVSCNPATFARDARRLVDGGYRLVYVQPVDQFVWSPHVELTACFEKRS